MDPTGGAPPPDRRALPPGQELRPAPPVMHYGPVPRLRPDSWTFTVGGATADGLEHTFDWGEMLALPRVDVVADMHCATSWSVQGLAWSGFRAADLVARVPPADGVVAALVFAEFGYAANVEVRDLRHAEALLATHQGGEALSQERGAPMRLVIPHLYTWKGPKWVRGWNYLGPDDVDQGFWEQRGYHGRGEAASGQRYAHQG